MIVLLVSPLSLFCHFFARTSFQLESGILLILGAVGFDIGLMERYAGSWLSTTANLSLAQQTVALSKTELYTVNSFTYCTIIAGHYKGEDIYFRLL